MGLCGVNNALQASRSVDAFTFDSSRLLNSDSNFLPMIRDNGPDKPAVGACGARQGRARGQGSKIMARFELPEFALSGIGEAPVSADAMFELGMMYASGREAAVDLITAHKWFNIAAMKGHAEGARMRREIAAEMKDAEIGQAQRAARDWLKAHPLPVVVAAPVLRAAA
jgi:uncharacterized protein